MTLRSAISSAHLRMLLSSSENTGGTVSISPRYTLPLPPSMVITSPWCNTVLPIRAVCFSTSTSIPSAPATQGLPMPRATTAACEVLPPRLVSTPSAAKKPWISSGLVSSRTRITLSPALRASSALSASNTIYPEEAPGEAGRPLAIGICFDSGSRRGCNN